MSCSKGQTTTEPTEHYSKSLNACDLSCIILLLNIMIQLTNSMRSCYCTSKGVNIHLISLQLVLFRDPGGWSRWVGGWVHRELVASQSPGCHMKTNIHTYAQFMESPINRQWKACFWTVGGGWREHAFENMQMSPVQNMMLSKNTEKTFAWSILQLSENHPEVGHTCKP